MFAVWEPILPTDYSSPGSAVLARISDPRVTQYWDKNHLFATQLGERLKADPDYPHPNCCNGRGFEWDEVAVYAPNTRWSDQLPRAVFLNGPVLDSLDFADAVGDLLSKSAGSKPTR